MMPLKGGADQDGGPFFRSYPPSLDRTGGGVHPLVSGIKTDRLTNKARGLNPHLMRYSMQRTTNITMKTLSARPAEVRVWKSRLVKNGPEVTQIRTKISSTAVDEGREIALSPAMSGIFDL